jgi:formate hydrogenlyase subunit 6/NADH:ubiquinone oxidoreductase subunit I
MWFKAYHEFGHDKSLDISNYRAKINQETCTGCGLCAKRCPMEAIQLETLEKTTTKVRRSAVLEADACIGCGVCAYKCPSESIGLERREEITEPPATRREFAKRFDAKGS